MIITCPCCRAANESASCRRCRADLSLLLALETSREQHLIAARRFAADGRIHDALQSVALASQLRPADDTRELRAALLLLTGDFPAALAAYDEFQQAT